MEKQRKNLSGVFTVMVTPMTKDQEFDEAGFKSNIDYQISKGISGLCVTGSTGEFTCLSTEERDQIVKVAIEHVNGRVPVIVGTAAGNTKEVIRHTKYAQSAGADAAMIINPYYALPTQKEIIEFFKMVGESVDIPIMAYNNPGCSGVDVTPDTFKEIAKIKNIEYLKDASGDIRRVRDIQFETNGNMRVFNGADDLAFEAFILGAVGWICVAGNIIPKECQEVYNLVKEGNIKEAKALYFKIMPLLTLLETCGKLVQTTKAGAELIGCAAGNARYPRLALEDWEMDRLKEVLKQIGAIS